MQWGVHLPVARSRTRAANAEREREREGRSRCDADAQLLTLNLLTDGSESNLGNRSFTRLRRPGRGRASNPTHPLNWFAAMRSLPQTGWPSDSFSFAYLRRPIARPVHPLDALVAVRCISVRMMQCVFHTSPRPVSFTFNTLHDPCVCVCMFEFKQFWFEHTLSAKF